MHRLILLAALAIASAFSSPAFADAAGTAVTWGGLGFLALLILGAVGVLVPIVFVLSIIASGYDH